MFTFEAQNILYFCNTEIFPSLYVSKSVRSVSDNALILESINEVLLYNRRHRKSVPIDRRMQRVLYVCNILIW